MRGNTVTIELPLKRGKVSKTIPLYQFDYGQKLIITGAELPEYYEVHFSNEMHGDAITSIGDETGVQIPDTMLTAGDPVYLWLFLHETGTDGETEFQGVIPVIKRARVSDQEPTPEEQSVITEAIAALNEAVGRVEAVEETIEEMSVSATTLEAGDNATVTKTVDPVTGEISLEFGIPAGEQGDPGEDGDPGQDGVSPTVAVSTISGGHRITITDASSSSTFDVMDGEKGDPGDPGEPGDPTELIDDTAGEGDTDLTWSADKLAAEKSSLMTEIQSKADEPTGTKAAGKVYGLDSNLNPAWVDQSGGGSVNLPIEPKDILSAQVGRNLFNIYTITDGYYVNKNNGQLVAGSSYCSSDYIEVEPDTAYGCNVQGHFAWYKSDKTYISGGSDTNTLNSPATAKYLRIDVTKTNLSKMMVCKGIARAIQDVGFQYEVYFPWLKVTHNIDAFAFNKFGSVVVNMFNKATAVDGQYVQDNNGYFSTNANYFRSDYIPVEPNTEYQVSHRNRYAVYDSNYQYITGANLDNGNVSKFTTPNNAAYVVICYSQLSKKDEYVIAKSTDFPAGYESYGVVVPWIKPSVPKSKYDGKTLVCFGDSITSDGYTTVIEADTGMTAINQGYASARYAYSADSNQYVNAFALHNIVDAIVTDDWSIPNIIIGVSGYSIQEQRLALLKTIDFSKVDFVSFAYGTNDFMSGTALDNQSNLYDTDTVKGSIRYCIKTLLTAYPHLKIIGATPIYRFWSNSGVIVSDCDTREVEGKYLKDYGEAIIEAFTDCHLPCVDNLTQAGINEYNRLNYFNISDGTHPKDVGRAIIGHRISAGILKEY